MTYEEYLKSKVKYPPNTKCGVGVPTPCKEPGIYEGGDSRCWFPMCERHADMRGEYNLYENYKPIVKEKLKIRLKEVLENGKD